MKLILSCYALAITAAVIFSHKNKHDCPCPQVDQVIDSTYFPYHSHFASITTQIHEGKKVLWKKFSYVDRSKLDSVSDADYRAGEEVLSNLENQ